MSAIVIPECLAQSIKEVLDAASRLPLDSSALGTVAGRSQACAIFLGEFICAQREEAKLQQVANCMEGS